MTRRSQGPPCSCWPADPRLAERSFTFFFSFAYAPLEPTSWHAHPTACYHLCAGLLSGGSYVATIAASIVHYVADSSHYRVHCVINSNKYHVTASVISTSTMSLRHSWQRVPYRAIHRYQYNNNNNNIYIGYSSIPTTDPSGFA